jgi:hypothetical protein
MASAVLRLLALIALALMPLSMVSAPAAAQPVPAGHCDDHPKPADAPAGPKVHCTACAALPAIDAPAPIAEMAPEAPTLIGLVSSLAGIEPDIATPPPKFV